MLHHGHYVVIAMQKHLKVVNSFEIISNGNFKSKRFVEENLKMNSRY